MDYKYLYRKLKFQLCQISKSSAGFESALGSTLDRPLKVQEGEAVNLFSQSSQKQVQIFQTSMRRVKII